MTDITDAQIKCPVCGGRLDSGHIPDFSHSRAYRLSWVRGQPAPSLLLGDIKWSTAARYPLEAYRCSGCGYVMLFAPKCQS